MELYFGWLGVGGHFLWVGRVGWCWVGVGGDKWGWSLVLVNPS